MPRAKAKAKHAVNALAKAVKTQRHAALGPAETNTVCVDLRTSAATAEFVIEEIGVGGRGAGTKKASTKSGMKTVLGAESSINVDRRIRNAAVPLGVLLDDGCAVEEELSLEKLDVSRSVRHFMPRRPAWSYEVSSGRLHFREAQGFQQWLADVKQLIAERGGYPPAYEQNLQVWRQLWRVLERCNVAVVVVDARHPLLHLPPALVYHVMRTLNKPLVVVLNKLDAVQPEVAERWAEALRLAVPGVCGVVGYSKEPLRQNAYKRLAWGKAALIETCHAAYAEHSSSCNTGQDTCPDNVVPDSKVEDVQMELPVGDEQLDVTSHHQMIDEAGRVMLGLVGHPNVGKSSLVNSLFDSKVVSVKATPGHTKTLQTLVLDERTCLCDSPGVVFPRLEVPRETQIVGMLIPLAQVREPFSAIRWVMERASTPLPELLNVKSVTLKQVLDFREAGTEVLMLEALPADVSVSEPTQIVPWSPMLLCAQYAVQRGLVRGGRPDCMKAGMEILERVIDGRIPYAVQPPSDDFHELAISLRARCEAEEDGEDSDWQLDDGDFESEDDNGDGKDKDLLEMFGEEAKTTGQCTIRSRKKADRKKKLLEAEAGLRPGTMKALPNRDREEDE